MQPDRGTVLGAVREHNLANDLPVHVWGEPAHEATRAMAELMGTMPAFRADVGETVMSREVPIAGYRTISLTPTSLPIPELSDGFPVSPVEVRVVDDAVVHTWCGYTVVTVDGEVLPDASTAYWPAFGTTLMPSPEEEDAGTLPEAFLATHDVDTINYCHFLADILPLLSLAADSAPRVPIVLDPVSTAYHAELLELADRRFAAPRMYLPNWTSLRVDRLYYPSRPTLRHPFLRCSTWAFNYVRGLVPRDLATDPDPGLILYVGRPRRRLLEEDEVLRLLRAQGCSVNEAPPLESVSVTEQARLFRSAAMVMGPHGAGFTNLVFRDSGPQMATEVFAPGNGTPAFALIARGVGMEHSSFLGAANPTEHPNYPDISVEPAELSEFVLEMLERNR